MTDAMTRVSRLYRRNCFPHLQDVRGATRLRLGLAKAALKSHALVRQENGRYALTVSGQTLYFRTFHGLIELVDENDAFRKFCEVTGRDDVVVDIGAHRGFYTLLGAVLGRKVHSFELSPIHAEWLRQNIAVNGVENVTVCEKAVTDTVGEMAADVDAGGNSRLDADGETVVPTTTLDAYFADQRLPDVIKIDAEGAEKLILDGGTAVLEERPELFIEIHPEKLAANGCTEQEIYTELKRYGYVWKTVERSNKLVYAS